MKFFGNILATFILFEGAGELCAHWALKVPYKIPTTDETVFILVLSVVAVVGIWWDYRKD